MILSDQQIEKRRQQAKAARQRAIAKQRAKMADPAWREKQYQKQRAAAQRRMERMQSANQKPPAPRKPIKSRGLKGRTPTAEERRIANALGSLPCIACYMHGVITTEVSLHHIEGRTAPGCHKKQIPLCLWHHQHAAPIDVRQIYPWLVPVHADGTVGGKAAFSTLNKPELVLLADAYTLAGLLL